jgi:chromosome segregation ATPase
MQQRGFSGTVEFDHKNHLLTVKSQTDNANDSTRCTNLKQMSGGERSYTALCLLLALGHVVSHK